MPHAAARRETTLQSNGLRTVDAAAVTGPVDKIKCCFGNKIVMLSCGASLCYHVKWFAKLTGCNEP